MGVRTRLAAICRTGRHREVRCRSIPKRNRKAGNLSRLAFSRVQPSGTTPNPAGLRWVLSWILRVCRKARDVHGTPQDHRWHLFASSWRHAESRKRLPPRGVSSNCGDFRIGHGASPCRTNHCPNSAPRISGHFCQNLGDRRNVWNLPSISISTVSHSLSKNLIAFDRPTRTP
jgi:hypothetical protein